MLVPLFSRAQIESDTIFKKDGKQIVCQITKTDPQYIYFNIGKLKGRYIHKEIVASFSMNGKREAVVLTQAENQSRQSTWSVQPALAGQKDTVDVSRELDFMKLCLRKCHREFVSGLICMGGSVVMNSIGGALLQDSPDAGKTFLVIGTASAIAGIILMIDSHKWINRAGLGIYGRSNEVGAYYRFK